MNTIYFDSPHDDDTRRANLYAGQLYVFSPTLAGKALCAFAAEMCEEAFAPYAPQEAQHHLEVEKYVEILAKLKPAFIHHPECKKLIPQLLDELHCDLEQVYFDVPRLRTACAGDYLSSGLAYAFKPHRDTWYSPPLSQLNWWLPVFPIESDNVMAFHPHYWDTPVKNSSNQFNYQDWNNTGRKDAAKQIEKDTRVQSEALEPMALQPELRVVCEPGGLVLFSAQQMHSTVPNATDLTRISIDFRTVHRGDLEAGREATNIDSESAGTTLMDYLRGTDQQHLPDEMIEALKSGQQTPMHPNPV
jgi:hypothetical protein